MRWCGRRPALGVGSAGGRRPHELVARVDIGGTFTDIVLRGPGGELVVDKVLTTHDDLLEGFFRGVGLVLGKAGVAPRSRWTGSSSTPPPSSPTP